MRFMPQRAGALYFIGIGGIGMSGLAELLHTLGYCVSGSDASESYNTKRLADKGIEIFIGHKAEQLREDTKWAAVVVSSAIKETNPELQKARALKIPVVHRADILAGLMRLKWSVGVAGTHGKTTTTSMLGTLLEAGGLDPTVINGGIVHAYGTNVRLGMGDWLVAETDESDGSFLNLPITASIITNIDPEHLDHYGTAENLNKAFAQFVENLPFYGFTALCADHAGTKALANSITDRRIIRYGFSDGVDVQCHDLTQRGTQQFFSITAQGKTFANLVLNVPGRHNVLNATGAVAIALELGLEETHIRQGLDMFRGVKRRFTTTGVVQGVTVVDDYAHHPAEIAAVFETARSVLSGTTGKMHVVVQPHRYTRLRDLMHEFADVLKQADHVAVADVYSAGETAIEGVNADVLASLCNASRISTPDQIAPWVAQNAQAGDMVLCLGAGSISTWAYALPNELQPLLTKPAAA